MGKILIFPYLENRKERGPILETHLVRFYHDTTDAEFLMLTNLHLTTGRNGCKAFSRASTLDASQVVRLVAERAGGNAFRLFIDNRNPFDRSVLKRLKAEPNAMVITLRPKNR